MAEQAGPDFRAEFERLVESRRDALVRSAARILHDADEAEDVVQETSLAVWKRASLERPRSLEAYVARAVQANALKRLAARKRLVPLQAVEGVLSGPPDEQSAGLEIDPGTLEEALAQLPLPQQAVIRMKYYTGLTFARIASVLSISINTAASRCRYALAAMRKALKAPKTPDSERSSR